VENTVVSIENWFIFLLKLWWIFQHFLMI